MALLLRLVRCHVCMRRHFRPMFVHTPELPVGYEVTGQGVDKFAFEKNEW